MRSISSGSLYSVTSHGRKRRRSCFSAASALNWWSRSSSIFCSGKCTGCASMVPASSREMSSRALKSSSIAAVEASMLSIRVSDSGCWLRAFSAATNSDSACSGCRRSWLAAAKKRDLAWLARSAMSFFAARSAVASRMRRSSSLRCACSASAMLFTPAARAPTSPSGGSWVRTARSARASLPTTWPTWRSWPASRLDRRQASAPVSASAASISNAAWIRVSRLKVSIWSSATPTSTWPSRSLRADATGLGRGSSRNTAGGSRMSTCCR